MQLSRLGTTRNTYLLVAALLFGAMPTRVFLAISSDIILVAAILLPFVMAFMIILSTEDISFSLPTTNDMDAKLEERREKVRVQLIDTLSQNLRLIIGVIAGKAICVWLIDCGTLAAILTHLIALLVGVLIVFCIDSFTRLIPVFNYLNIAAEMGAAVKKHLLRDRRL